MKYLSFKWLDPSHKGHCALFLCILLGFIIIFFDEEAYCIEAKNPKNIATANSAVPDGLYRIGIGDILDIITWKETDFSREDILVRGDGNISFPLLNDIKAAGKTPMTLKKDIETGLKQFVGTPVVTVIIKNPMSQKFYIIGEVVHTGEYPLMKELSVLQALALAGGFTEWAAKDEIILFRNENGVEKIIRIKYYNIIKGKDFSQNVLLKANDTIIVP